MFQLTQSINEKSIKAKTGIKLHVYPYSEEKNLSLKGKWSGVCQRKPVTGPEELSNFFKLSFT
jgi:hypothetical protein